MPGNRPTATTNKALMGNQPYVHIPETISRQAQEFLRTPKDPALTPQFPDPADIAAWKKLQAWAEADGKAKSESLLKRYDHTVEQRELGGVPVLDVRPKGWKDNGKALVYTHGVRMSCTARHPCSGGRSSLPTRLVFV